MAKRNNHSSISTTKELIEALKDIKEKNHYNTWDDLFNDIIKEINEP